MDKRAENTSNVTEEEKQTDPASHSILSFIDATLEPIGPLSLTSASSIPSKTKIPDTIPLENTKSIQSHWINHCSSCKRSGSKRHSPTKCCLVCRNYSSIDDIAETWNVRKILELKFQGRALREQLQGEYERYNSLRTQEKELYQRQRTCKAAAESLFEPRNKTLASVQKAIRKYNGIVKNNPHRTDESVAAKSDYDVTKKHFDNSERSFQNAKSRFNKALEDHAVARRALSAQVDTCKNIVSRIAQRLLRAACIPERDKVGRARLFFSWISNSITYNATAHDESDSEERIPLRTILKTSETCHGFAGLFDAMFNSGHNAEPNGCSIYIPGHIKEGRCRNANDANGHAWNAFPLGDGTWKLIDTTLASSSRNSEQYVRQAWFTRRNEDFLRTHIPEERAYQFRDGGQRSIESDTLWKADYVHCTSQCERYQISQSSLRPFTRIISVSPASRTVFKFKKTCTHLHDAQHSFVVWTGKDLKGDRAGSVDWDDLTLVPLMLDKSGWRVSIKLPKASTSVILFALLSDGHCIHVTSLDEWGLLNTKRSYVMIARWTVQHSRG